MSPVYINAISAYMPNDPVSNDQMEGVLGQSGPKASRARRTILRSNGIKTRYYAVDPSTGQTTHSNAQITANAIQLLAEQSDFDLSTTDCLACGTTLADQLLPNHAVMTHGELGIPPCEVIATAGVCVAGMTALKYAYLGVAAGEFVNAVATGSETASAVLRGRMFKAEVEQKIAALEKRPEIAFDKDFLRWMLSDGAGAVLLQPHPNIDRPSLKVEWIFERSYANEMDACMYGGSVKNSDGSLTSWKEFEPTAWLDESVFSIKQDVKQLNEHVIHYTVEKPLTELMLKKSLKAADIDYFVPHYSSEFFRDKVAEGMAKVGFDIPFERWFSNLSTKGNTGSASIYIHLEELFNTGNLSKGEKILCYVPESGRFSTAYMLLTVV